MPCFYKGACRMEGHAGSDRVGRLREPLRADGSVEVRSLRLHSLSGCPAPQKLGARISNLLFPIIDNGGNSTDEIPCRRVQA